MWPRRRPPLEEQEGANGTNRPDVAPPPQRQPAARAPAPPGADLATAALTVRGRLDATATARLAAAIARAPSDGDARLSLDCSQLAAIDLEGVARLLRLRRHAANHGVELELWGLGRESAELIRRMGFEGVLVVRRDGVA